MRRGYFIVATVLRAPYCAPFPFAPARHYYQSGGVIRQRETAATSSCDCRLLSTAASGSVPATRRTKAAGYRDGTFNHRRRQQKRCGSRHLYRYAGCLSGAAFPPRIISHWDTFTARNVSAAQSISAIAARPSPSALMSAAKANACIW